MSGTGQTVLCGRGSSRKLRPLVLELGLQRVFLVTARRAYRTSGAREAVEFALGSTASVRFQDYETNPRLEDVIKATTLCRSERCDSVIGLGGGTAIDIAKAVAFLVTQGADPEAIMAGRHEADSRRTPFVAIPTTAGTGSESTHFSVIYVDGSKCSLAHDSMLADYAVLDASLTDDLPPHISACSGLDALSQAVESFWSIKATEESRRYSLEALGLALANLVRAARESDPKARELMLKAANLAGRAINIARTTAAHALSYGITTRFGVPHGHAVALTLPHLVHWNLSHAGAGVFESKGGLPMEEMSQQLMQALRVDSPEAARDRLRDLIGELGLETRLSALGIAASDLKQLAVAAGASDRAGNNPVALDQSNLVSILEQAL